MKKTELKYIAMVVIPHACMIYFCLIMIFTRAATPYIFGFGVDSTGRVYVGENEGICIYQEQEKIGSIRIKGDNYLIDVDENDNIRVVYPSRVDWMDAAGNIIETMADPQAHTYSQLSIIRQKFTAANGDTYKLLGHYGWTRIVKNDSEMVYRQSVLSFYVKSLMQICSVSFFISVIWVVYYTRKKRAGTKTT